MGSNGNSNNTVRELVVLSGKGGTGKTSLTASFAALAKPVVLADCDVDAADLHIITAPDVRSRSLFVSGKEAIVDGPKCAGCGLCAAACRFDAFDLLQDNTYQVVPVRCEGCGLCVHICPEDAIRFEDRECGEWMISDTRFGTMVHARLHAAGENSGKLVTLVRREAKRIAEKEGRPLVLVDGPPGIGCPVISSITGSSAVLLVTEPSVSGMHDLKRVTSLARGFDIPVFVCVNKADVDYRLSDTIRRETETAGHTFVGSIPFDQQMVQSQLRGMSAIEFVRGSTRDHIEQIWERIWTAM